MQFYPLYRLRQRKTIANPGFQLDQVCGLWRKILALLPTAGQYLQQWHCCWRISECMLSQLWLNAALPYLNCLVVSTGVDFLSVSSLSSGRLLENSAGQAVAGCFSSSCQTWHVTRAVWLDYRFQPSNSMHFEPVYPELIKPKSTSTRYHWLINHDGNSRLVHLPFFIATFWYMMKENCFDDKIVLSKGNTLLWFDSSCLELLWFVMVLNELHCRFVRRNQRGWDLT